MLFLIRLFISRLSCERHVLTRAFFWSFLNFAKDQGSKHIEFHVIFDSTAYFQVFIGKTTCFEQCMFFRSFLKFAKGQGSNHIDFHMIFDSTVSFQVFFRKSVFKNVHTNLKVDEFLSRKLAPKEAQLESLFTLTL